jgi:hypothetical protein
MYSETAKITAEAFMGGGDEGSHGSAPSNGPGEASPECCLDKFGIPCAIHPS